MKIEEITPLLMASLLGERSILQIMSLCWQTNWSIVKSILSAHASIILISLVYKSRNQNDPSSAQKIFKSDIVTYL